VIRAFSKDLDQGGIAIDIFAKGSRRSARAVAQVGLERLFAGKLSSIDGRINRLKALSLRLVPGLAARFSKTLMTSNSTSQPSITPKGCPRPRSPVLASCEAPCGGSRGASPAGVPH
jgi:hypothetical protein